MDWRCGSSGKVPALQLQSPAKNKQTNKQTKRKDVTAWQMVVRDHMKGDTREDSRV
jgi:hypothetical protein